MERYLTDTDLEMLAKYEDHVRRIQHEALACLNGLRPGLLLFGRGGTGKTWAIRQLLRERKVNIVTVEEGEAVHTALDDTDREDDTEGDWPMSELTQEFGHDSCVIHKVSVTPKGLLKEMQAFPRSVHMIEDAETVFDNNECAGVLRAALDRQEHVRYEPRRITNRLASGKTRYDFTFYGSIIVVGNRPPNAKRPEVAAMLTRCPPLRFDISNRELIAKMKTICERGYRLDETSLSKDECYDVLEFILNTIETDVAIRSKWQTLDLRILIEGFICAVHSKEQSDTPITWQSSLHDKLAGQVGYGKTPTRAERTHELSEAAKEIKQRAERGEFRKNERDKIRAYCERIGRPTAWYETLKAVPNDKDALRAFNAAKQNYKNMLAK